MTAGKKISFQNKNDLLVHHHHIARDVYVYEVKMAFQALCHIYIYVTVYRKTRHNAAPFEIFLLHLRSCRRPDIELSKFYRHSLSRSRYNRPNRSLPSAWNNTFLRNRSIFSRYYARRVVPGFPVDGHIYSKLDIFTMIFLGMWPVRYLTISQSVISWLITRVVIATGPGHKLSGFLHLPLL